MNRYIYISTIIKTLTLISEVKKMALFNNLLRRGPSKGELQQKIMQNKVQQLEETNSDEKRLNKFSKSLANESPDTLNDSETNSISQRAFDFNKNAISNNFIKITI